VVPQIQRYLKFCLLPSIQHIYKQCHACYPAYVSRLKFLYADFYRNFPTRKIADTYHESRRHKPSQHVDVFATKSMTSPRQTRLRRFNGIQSVTMHWESLRLSQSRRNGIWVYLAVDVIALLHYSMARSRMCELWHSAMERRRELLTLSTRMR